MANSSGIERALVVTAHPDDLDFGAGGTIALWTAAGIEVTYCICTNGDAGGFDPKVPRSDIPGIRQQEQRAAAAILGVNDVRFLGYPDGKLTASLDVRRDISRVIRDVRPQRVLTQSPEIFWERLPASHPDHRAAGEATLAAIYPDARNPFAHPELLLEGFEAWIVPELWVMSTPRANHVVDITDTFSLKMKALQAHESQVAHMDDLEVRIREWANDTSTAFNLSPGRIGEAFHVIEIS